MATNQVSALARGVVVVLQGKAWVVNAAGERIELKVGDEVQEGQIVVTDAGTRLELALPNGETLFVAAGRELLIDATLLGTAPQDRTEAALKDLNSGAAQVARVIAAGGDLSTELDPTAAGATGGDNTESHSFVRVLRIDETLTPLDQASATDSSQTTTPITAEDTPNQAPIAIDDALSATEDTPLIMTLADLAGNDTDPDGDVLSIISVQTPVNGTVVLNGGNVVFTPNANYNGPASFSYTLSDGRGGSDTATVNLTVGAVNDAPIATDDLANTTPEDTPLTLGAGTLLGNDTDVDGDPLSIISVQGAVHGSVTLVNGNVVFTPAPNYNGPASFTYTVSDGQGGTSTATVNLTVTPVEDAPDAGDDALVTDEDTSLSISPSTLTTNDSDPDGDPLTIVSVQSPVNGTVSLLGGQIVFTPAPNYNGPASFTYTVSDGHGGTDTATVNIQVRPVNDTPDAVDDYRTLVRDTTMILSPGYLTGNDTDPDGDNLSIISVQDAINGSVSLSGGAVVFTPTAGFLGTATFTYTISDGHGGTDTATVTLNVTTPPNSGPDAVNDSGLSTPVGAALTVASSTLLGNDSDADGDSLSIASVQSAVNGSIALVGGNVVFTPTAGYSGPASFTYTISDGHGGTDTATVTLTVGGVAVNNVPDAVDDGVLAATIDTPLTVGSAILLGNDTDADGDSLSIASVQSAVNGSIALVGGNVVFTPTAGYSGPASFTYTISDGHGGTDTATVAINVGVGAGNQPPNAVDDGVLNTSINTTLFISTAAVLGNDSDPNGDLLSVVSAQDPIHGTVSIVGGNIVFTPDAGYVGAASFTYTISDGLGGTDTATVAVNVTNGNSAPINTVPIPQQATEDQALVFNIANGNALSVSDVDGGTLTSAVSVTNGTLTAVVFAGATISNNGTGSITVSGTAAAINGALNGLIFAPTADYNGPATLTLSSSDGALTDLDTVAITVSAVADIIADTVSTAENTPITANVITGTNGASADSFEGTPVLTSVTNGSNGSVTFTPAGNVTYTPNANFNGADSFTYTVTSPAGVTETATVNVTVTPGNDPTLVTGGTSGSGAEDAATITGTLLASDLDGLTDGSVYTVSGAPAHGTASINAASGAWSYTPTADYNGVDSFTVTITDDAGNPTTQVINLTLAAVVDIANDTLATAEDTPVVILASSLLANDSFENGAAAVTSVGTAANGTVSLSAGSVTYTPNANFNGADSFTYTVTSPAGVTETATVNVTVTPGNDPTLVTGGTSGSGAEDAATITGTLLASDLDGLTDGSVYTVSGAPAHGTASINAASGAWSYTPTADYNGVDSFTVTITDDAGNPTTQVINLTLAAVVDIANDTLATAEDTPVVILASSLLANDSFENGAAAVTSVGTAANGTVSLSAGSVTYTPNANFNGADSFTYTVTSPAGVTETATVNVTVTPGNDPTLVTGGTSGSGAEDAATITGTLLASDLDGLTDGSVYTVSGAPAHGTASINAASGAWSYTPTADYNGVDSFTVTITDDAGNPTTQVINLTLAAVVDIANDTLATAEDTPVVILASSLLANDSFENGAAAVTSVGTAANGTVSLSAGSVTYTPNANFNGADSFTYTVTSPAGVTETATVNVTVTPGNDPTLVTGGTSGSGAEDAATITGTLLASDLDGLTDGSVYTVSGAPAHGTASINAASGAWSYTPTADYNGVDSFTVTITDDAGNPTTQVINLTLAAVVDIANDTLATAEDTPVVILASSLLANDSFENGAAAVTSVGTAANGTVSLSAGSVTYTPNANFNGADSFTYTVTSPAGVTETATVNVTVTPGNDPTLVTGGTSGSGAEDAATITGTLLASDLDGLTDGSVYTVSGAPAHGTASINAASGAWSYTPTADYNGVDSFTVTITDDAGNPTTQVINLTLAAVVDIANDTLATAEDTPVVILASSLLANDSFENGAAAVTSVGTAANGTVSLSAGSVTYTPNANFNGADSFTYTVTSPAGVTETATVNVTVTPGNDPTLVTGGTSGSGAEDAATITGTLLASDLDGLTDGSVYTVSGAPAHGTASINAASGAWSYTPTADYNGVDSFTVTITDDAGNPTTQVINLTLAAVVDIANDTLATAEDTPVVILASSLLANDSFENGAAAVTSVGTAANGTVSLSAGSVTYTPNANFNGADSFTYTVTSPAGVTETATVNVTVTPGNDPTLVTGGTSGSGAEDAATITGTLLASDLDGLTDGSVYTVSGAPAHGTASINAASGAWSYTPTADYNGVDSFTVTITDDAGNPTTQVINLTLAAVVDIANDTLATAEDTPVVILASSLLANDSFENGAAAVTSVGTAANGTVSLSAGSVTYTPNANFNGADSFTYTVTSPAGVTETATVNVTVTPGNDPTLVTGGTSGSGAEDAATITGTLLASDLDGLTDGSVYTVSGAPAHGTASINAASGAWSYTPTADYNGVDSFTVTITDDAGNPTTQVINLTLAAVVDIANDTLATAEDTPVVILASSLLANDSFENGAAAVTSVGTAANGTVSLSAGSVTYTPNANFNGADSFTYTVTSPAGVTETATVNVTVTPGNDPTLVTGGTSGSGAEDAATITGTLLASDLDGLTDGSVYTVSGAPAHGTASINAASGAWSYTPTADYNGVDSFTVTITDDAGNPTTQVINLTLAAVVDIANDTLATAEDTPVVILASSLLANDSFENGAAAVTSVGTAANGTVSLSAGSVTYTPNANFNGADSFTYTVTSPAGVTETATVNVTVTPGNDPTLVTGGTSGSGAEDAATITGTLLASDLDGLTDGSVYTVSGAPAHGTASINAASGAWSYTPTADYNGVDSFTVTITDDAGNPTTQVINLTLAAVVDIANDTLATAEDTPVVILASSLLANDSFENGAAAVTSVGTAANGTVSLSAGSVTYTPNANFNGADSFTYTVTSPAGVTETATVNVTVTPGNDPTLVTGGTSGSGAEDAATITGTLLASDLDGLTDGSVYTVSGAPAHGTASINAASGAWSYTPTADYNGVDSFTVTITDDAGNPTTQVINLTLAAVVDIANDTLATAEDTPVVILASSLLANDSFENGAAAVTSVGTAANGTVSLSAGSVTYTPNANFNGADSFTYTVTSPAGVTETATVNVTVTPGNDPTLVTGGTSGSGAEDAATITGTLLASDLDGLTDGSVYTVSGAPAHGTASINAASGAWSYTPTADYNGVDSFTVTITDDAGNPTTQVINLTLAAVVDIANDTLATAEDTLVNISVNTNDSFENAGHTVTAINGIAIAVGGSVSVPRGSVTLKADGTLDFTPEADFNGAVPAFSYTVTSGGTTEVAFVNVNVTPVGDPFQDISETVSIAEDTIGTGNVLTGTTSVDGPVSVSNFTVAGDATVYTAGSTATIAGMGTFTLNGAGVYTFTPVANYNGPVPLVSYTMTDGSAPDVTSTLAITVMPVDDSFADTNETVVIAEDNVGTGNVLTGTTSVDGPVSVSTFTVAGDATVYTVGSTATITDVGTFTLTGTGVYTFTPVANYTGPVPVVSYTVTDGSGTGDNSTLAITVTPVNDAPVLGSGNTITLSEEGLTGGITDATGNPTDTTDLSTRTGTISVADPDNVPTVTLTAPLTALSANGVAVTWSGNGSSGTPLIGMAGSTEVFRATIDNTGNYTVTLSKAIDHANASGENLASFDIGVSATDGTLSATSKLTVNIEDDAPTAVASAKTVALPSINTNIELILDVSGSMTTTDGGGGKTRLQVMKEAVTLMLDQYDNLGDVLVRVVSFSDNATQLGGGWVSVATAKTLVNALAANGATNYDAALTTGMSAWASPGKMTNAQNLSYFLTDGAPTAGRAIGATDEGLWTNFLTSNSINSFSYGLGTGATATNINPIAYNGAAGLNTNATVVTDISQLPPILRDSVVIPTGGDLVSGGLGAGSGLGADGGYLLSLTIDSSTYTYNAASGGSISVTGTNRGVFDTTGNSLTITTVAGGKFVVDMDDGQFSYSPPGTTTVAFNETMGFTLRDNDGDTASSSLTIAVSPPVGAPPTGFDSGSTSLTGSNTNDSITGTGGNDAISGGYGNDTISAGAGADTIRGGQDNDSLTGGAGADTFVWNLADRGFQGTPATDAISDFTGGTFASGGDRLNLQDLLQSENHTTGIGNLANYLDFSTSGGTTTLRISSTGGFTGGTYSAAAEDQRITFTGVDIRTALGLGGGATDANIIQELINRGKLITD